MGHIALPPALYDGRTTAMSEILTNGDFASWTSATDADNWTESVAGTSTVNREGTAGTPFSGTYCCRLDVDATPSAVSVAQAVTLSAAETHRLFLYYKASAAGAQIGIQITDDTTADYLQADGSWAGGSYTFEPAAATAWTEYSLWFTPVLSGGTHTVKILNGTGAASKSLYIDAVSLKRGLQSTTTPHNYYFNKCRQRRAGRR